MPEPITSTYRVQLHGGFGFDAVAGIVPYLRALGISHLYLSPFLQAVRGSTHGYDVVDPTRINDELGGRAGFDRLREVSAEHRLGLVLDVVPNHLAISMPGNRWWWDVLENGPASRYANYFDVDWNTPESRLRDLVLVPILSDHYGRELERGAIAVAVNAARDGFVVRYGEHELPVAPRTIDHILQTAASRCASDPLAAIADAYAALPISSATDPDSMLRRHRGKEWLRDNLRQLRENEPPVARAIDQVIAELNDNVEELHALLERQNYRLAYWRTAERDLGYRRFFDINTLAGLRVEDDAVFADSHALILEWLAHGFVDGLRIDHVDGLRDPDAYLNRVRQLAPQTWVVVEKILAPDESLCAEWPVEGATGYESLNLINALCLDPAAEESFTSLYRELIGTQSDWPSIAHAKKRLAMQQALASDVNRLTALLVDICERHRRHRDHTRHELHEALREIIACFPVYRTYVRPRGDGNPRPADAAVLAQSVAAARANRADLDPALFDFLHDLLADRIAGRLEAELISRFQQLTGPVTAKGIEDTAFYCFNRFVGLNEVGADPQRFGTDVTSFHAACAAAQRDWPRRMVTTSTHDTKRSIDVRARLAVLTEIPERWAATVRHWFEINEPHHRGAWPDANFEYLLYQTLVGAWPLSTDRALQYAIKAAREAKEHTSWGRPDEAYESALRDFVTAVLSDATFVAELNAFIDPLLDAGRVNALTQTLVAMTMPGIPDVFQGTELWDLSLVDPDNRRPVDFTRRATLLSQLDHLRPEEIWNRRHEGLPKLWVMRQALALRRDRPEWFGSEASYEAIRPCGRHRDRLIAFCRSDRVVTVAPRLTLAIRGRWEDTSIEIGQPDSPWHDLLSGARHHGSSIPVGRLLQQFPVALLLRE